jgi:hypothetical protein
MGTVHHHPSCPAPWIVAGISLAIIAVVNGLA